MGDPKVSVVEKGDKVKYTVEIEGEKLTRTTVNKYSHAVIVYSIEKDKWLAAGFCGRLDLAEKKAKEFIGRRDLSKLLIISLEVTL
jgi:hypothetical protein